METLLALLPLGLVLGLLASGRASALVAGLAGLTATLAASATIIAQSHGGNALGRLFLNETMAGLWLSGQVIAIIATGIFFHHCQQARGEATTEDAVEATPRRLWTLCFLVGPFAESVTGFGVGYMIALASLRRLGLGGLPILLLGLYSQSLVPWGALAISTTVGATLAGLTPNGLGLDSAVLQMPIHGLYLALYWRFARAAGVVVPFAQKLDDLAWTGLLLLLIWLANRYGDVEIAGAAPTALLAALRFWRDERPDRARLASAVRTNAPYIALTLALCATRLVPPLRHLLQPLWAMKPFDNQPAFAPLYAPGFWLVAIGIVVVLMAQASLTRVIAKAAQSAWRACLVTLVFVVMAELYVGSGMAQQIAEALEVAIGREAALGVPLFAAIGGFLTGGGATANAMLMPMVTALGHALMLDPSWIAAVQNSLCTNLTMLSPIRIAMGVALLGLKISDAELYRHAWPLALPPMIVGIAAIALLLLASV